MLVERDPRDRSVGTLFCLIMFRLLLGAAVKGRMKTAGFDSVTLCYRKSKSESEQVNN